MSEPDLASNAIMRFRILLPEEILLDEDAVKIIAETIDGSFGLLPRHVDFVAPLPPGIVLITKVTGQEVIIGIDEGTLVKCGQDISISTRHAIVGADLETLRERVEHEFKMLDEHEATARTALARLEAGIIRHFIELEDKP